MRMVTTTVQNVIAVKDGRWHISLALSHKGFRE
jgi:hypothetical protein